MGLTVVGREVELAAVQRFLGQMDSGPAGLIVEGDAGIGKTTVWTAGCEAARRDGRLVLVARAVETEAKLGYAGLADLLSAVDDDAIHALPAPLRRALDAALLRASPTNGSPPDPRAVATAVLSLLEELARECPVVLALDDLQWLDASTARAISFVARRLAGRVGLLATMCDAAREPGAGELSLRDDGRLVRLRLQPLDRGAAHALLRERLGRSFAQPSLRRIERVAAGNPFLALELARSLDVDGQAGPAKLPESLREIVDARLAGLAAPVRAALLIAAALARARVRLIQSAIDGDDAIELLGRAEAAGVVQIEGGQVRFTHPLLASGVYAAAAGAQRRAAHRRLSEVVEGVEERARHLALASVEPDPTVLVGT